MCPSPCVRSPNQPNSEDDSLLLSLLPGLEYLAVGLHHLQPPNRSLCPSGYRMEDESHGLRTRVVIISFVDTVKGKGRG